MVVTNHLLSGMILQVWDCNYDLRSLKLIIQVLCHDTFFVVSITSWPRTMSGEGAVGCFGVAVKLGRLLG